MSYKIESPLPVIEGGTGVISTTSYAVLCGGTTSTNPLQSIASVGTSGQVLTSNGAGALPTFQTGVVGEVSTLTGDTGGAISPILGNINIITNVSTINCGSSVLFDGSSNTITLNVTDSGDNTVIGLDAGNASLVASGALGNTILGNRSGKDITSGINNTLVGLTCGSSMTIGAGNTFVGSGAGFLLTTGLTNALFGAASGNKLTTGSFNTLIGTNAGTHYTSNESSNICLGYQVLGTIAESNVLRIGISTGTGAGQLNQSFIAGIYGITPATADGIPVYIGSDGQLGTVGTAVSSLTSIAGDTGGPQTGPAIILESTSTAGSSVSFSGLVNTISLNVTDVNSNTIIGNGAGNLTISGAQNSVFGKTAGSSITSGSNNTIMGFQAARFLDIGAQNVAIGFQAATALIDGNFNTMVGFSSASAIATGDDNTMIGNSTAPSLTSGARNTILGSNAALSFASGTDNTILGASAGASLGTASSNTFVGAFAGNALAGVSGNVILGYQAGITFTSGSGNIIIGNLAAITYTTNESNNIIINSNAVIGDSNVLRIGESTGSGSHDLNKSFIAGIYGITPTTNDGIPVYISSDGQLGTVGVMTTTYTNVNTSPYVVLSTDNYISVDCSGGAITIQLPNAASLGRIYIIKDRTGSAAIHNITITTVGGAVNIDGAVTFVMNTAFESIDILGNGSTYEIY